MHFGPCSLESNTRSAWTTPRLAPSRKKGIKTLTELGRLPSANIAAIRLRPSFLDRDVKNNESRSRTISHMYQTIKSHDHHQHITPSIKSPSNITKQIQQACNPSKIRKTMTSTNSTKPQQKQHRKLQHYIPCKGKVCVFLSHFSKTQYRSV